MIQTQTPTRSESNISFVKQYDQIDKVDGNKIYYSIDDSLHIHFIGLIFDSASPWCEPEREMIASLTNVKDISRDSIYFLLKSTWDTSELVSSFLAKFKSIQLQTVSDHETPKEYLEQFISTMPVVDRTVLESYQSPEEKYIQNNLQKILWSDNPQRTINKVIRYHFHERITSSPERFVKSLTFDKMLPRGWEADLTKAAEKYATCWVDDQKRKSLIVLDAFDYMASQIPEDDRFMSCKNQTVTQKECQFLLYKLTLWIYTKKRRNGFSRKYFDRIKNEYKTATGKTLTHHKIGHITKILHCYDLITKVIHTKSVSVYDIGPNNPFYDYYKKGRLLV